MKLLALSEHYFPRLGGTTNYVHETLNALARLGVEAELLVPGPLPPSAVPQSALYRVTPVDAAYPPKGDPTAAQRLTFCARANGLVEAKLTGDSANRPDLVQVLFGLFIMEALDVSACRAAGVPALATVHNVPPLECGRLMPDAGMVARMKERLRLLAVSLRNAKRLKQRRWDLLIAPSEPVAALLRTELPGTRIDVIGHGPTTELQALLAPHVVRRPVDGAPLRLLTVGGFVPHKRQHLVPEIAARLRAREHEIEWHLAGPPGRIAGYFDLIRAEVRRRSLDNIVILHPEPPFLDLARLYDVANLYVQPSTEEGFCLTALDAAAAGLPVIASPAGALSEIAAASGGRCVKSEPAALAEAIHEFADNDCWSYDTTARAQEVRTQFAWSAAATRLAALQAELIGKASERRA